MSFIREALEFVANVSPAVQAKALHKQAQTKAYATLLP